MIHLPNQILGSLSNAWEVLLLFLIPVGGGIPAGVLMARSRNIEWPEMILLYLISDVILACLFEPLMLLVIAISKRSSILSRFSQLLKNLLKPRLTSSQSSTKNKHLKPHYLILLSFAADPMTGRTAAVAAGHGFIAGWTLAITGDLFYFGIIMISTLWLSTVLGDGTWATVIITLGMGVIPPLIRKIQRKIPGTDQRVSTQK